MKIGNAISVFSQLINVLILIYFSITLLKLNVLNASGLFISAFGIFVSLIANIVSVIESK